MPGDGEFDNNQVEISGDGKLDGGNCAGISNNGKMAVAIR